MASKLKKPKRKWLKWVLPAILSSGAICVLTYSLLQQSKPDYKNPSKTKSIADIVNKITYEEARRDENKRQKYIDQIIQKYGKPHYLAEVVYDPEEDGYSGNEKNEVYRKLGSRGMLYTGGIKGKFKDIGKKKIPIRTRITKMAFEMPEEAFLLSLLSHERTMAKIIYKGFSQVPTDIVFFKKNRKEKFSNTLFTLLCEIEAYSADIDYCKQHNLSERLTNYVKKKFKKYYNALKNNLNTTSKQFYPKIKMAVEAYKRDDF